MDSHLVDSEKGLNLTVQAPSLSIYLEEKRKPRHG